ncbi:hypothetical protein PFLUOLIPICF7_15285 [Pseudomonas simiae]|uniref:YkgJ family cysteine cluster protein n=1 Tax=Pseudomonas simiae TaxID=321846 RepID=UPI0005D7878A|nr:YkgJ family cysteine cluster protein [Pseudomonas simiae]AJZ94810.1 hypothetical protein PFLUOLIPICF7_15285 [Pseudomonas simiae]
MNCREGCGACCIAPSISSPLPGMPQGKPAGGRRQPERPAVCSDFKANIEVCGTDQADAIRLIGWWEQMTAA